MDHTPSVLFAISDTGGGHRAGAAAIDAALAQLADGTVDRHIVDMLTSTGLPLIKDAPDLYNQLSTRWLSVFDLMFQMTDGRRRIDALTQFVYLSAHRNIVRVFEETRPDLVVSVHPLVNRLIGNARRTYRLSFHFVTVVTDLVSLHSAWADPGAELCIVPTEEAYQLLLRRGFPARKLVRTGFPVHPKFAAYAGTRREARATLGIEPDPFTLLITSGGVGSGQLRELVLTLEQAYPALQLLVVTGKNASLRAELEALGLRPSIRIYGFVNNMEVLMAASDIIVTKAGPGTLMEALVMRRPVIVTEAVGMQERGNIDLVLNRELGAFCPTPDRIVPAIDGLMDPATYAATVARLAEAVPRDGATQIAQVVLDRLQLPPPSRRRMRLLNIDAIRQIGARRPRLHLPAARARQRRRARAARLRTISIRNLPRWRKSRRAPPSG
ncbi:MGDG synthase family glycosyltransferase [Kouleothrix sp.]|uniref:MGDG synthase family glycosyltransferase n=1 Tax=Kouleothrix sp. TaxID=2779161 RepID=UPI00391D66C8